MSTITVTNIQATGETASRAVSGVAAAHARITYSSGTPIINSNSFNFSSVADTETGGWTVSFTNSMDNNNYTVSGVVTNDRVGLLACALGSAYTTSQKKMQIQDSRNATQYDWDSTITIHGDLA